MNPTEENLEKLKRVMEILENTIALKDETIASQSSTISSLEQSIEIYKSLYEAKVEERDAFLHAFESIFMNFTGEQKASMPNIAKFYQMVHLVLYGNTETIDK